MKKDFWLYNLFRHQIAGFIATIVDFGVFNLLIYGFGVWYVTSNAIGAIVGAVVNFIISTRWAFAGSKNSLKNQIFKYSLVSFGSMVLNTFFVYLLTDIAGFSPNGSKIIVAITVAWTFNFLLMRYYVFKK